MTQKNRWLVIYGVLISVFTIHASYAQEDEPMSIPEPSDPIVQPVTPPATQPSAGTDSRPSAQSAKQNLRPKKKHVVDEEETWGVLISPGLTFGNSTSYKSTSTSITGAGTASTDTSTSVSDSSGLIFGVEGDYRFNTYFQLCAALEFSKYNYTGGGPNDTHIGFYIIPRVQYETYRAVFWAGLGLGLMHTSIGIDPASTLTVSSPTSIAFSPRIGVDFETGTMFLAGVQMALTTFGATVDVAGATAAGTPVTLSQEFSRKWFALQGRVGIRF
jgi:hypothetical protein